MGQIPQSEADNSGENQEVNLSFILSFFELGRIVVD